MFQLSRKNGLGNPPRTYRLGENDIYWFHSSFDERFWIIPEVDMHIAGWITHPDETKQSKHIKINPNTYMTNSWLKQYEFDYSKLTDESIAKIKALFSIL